jgi:hypothetical protein
MATIDCTLDALKIPGFSGFTPPPFGTKIDGPISSRDENNNMLMPFLFQRPKMIGETSTTTQIQRNTVFEFVTGGISLTLGNSAFSGCRVSVINSAATDVTVNYGSISLTVRAKESIHLEWVNGTWTEHADLADGIAYAMDLGGRAHQEIKKTLDQRIQTGTATIINRGVISGLTVGKSSTALRNIVLNGGTFFMDGMDRVCPDAPNNALVPDNYADTAKYCYAYIYFDSNGAVKFACTPFDGAVPAGAMTLYRISVPAGNNHQNDPYLAAVTMTDVRRVEAGYPMQFNSVAYVSVALPYNLLDAEYTVHLEILDYKGGYNQRPIIHADDKASNGFSIRAEGTLDTVRVRWTVLKPSL